MIVFKDTIKFEYKNVYDLTNDKIGIPIFQRFYSWKKIQTVQLLLDILEVCSDKSKDLYLLDFIYYEEANRKMIADGQQRIVTLNILFFALNEYISKNSLSIEKLNLFKIEYDILEHHSKYYSSFNEYMKAPFKAIYLHFMEWIDLNKDLIHDIIEVLKNNIKVYFKKCDNADDAFVIFQQINTGGKPLTKDEIILTAIQQFSDIYSIPLSYKVKDIKISLVSYYKYITGDTSKEFDNISIISFIKKEITRDKKSFQKFVDTLKTLANLENNPITSVFNWINRSSLYDVLNVLAMKGIDTNVNREYLEKIVIPLTMLSITLSLTGGLPSILKYLMNNVINMINRGDKVDTISLYIAEYINSDESSYKIDFNSFLEALSGNGKATQGIKKAILLLDVIISNTSGTVNVSKINLEHIYPQKPSINWASKGWPTNKEDQKVIMNNIGNHFLLCEVVNQSISNKYITDKVVQYNYILEKDAILKTKINYVDFKRFEIERERYIYSRQLEIANHVYKTFPFAKVLIINETGITL